MWETDIGASPEAKESTANKRQRFRIIALLSTLIFGSNARIEDLALGSSSSELSLRSGAVSGSTAVGISFSLYASTALLKDIARRNLIIPTIAYPQKITRYDLIAVHFRFSRKWFTSHPDNAIAHAMAAEPVNEYQAYTSLRFATGVRCAKIDSSIARNGPISLPLPRISLCPTLS